MTPHLQQTVIFLVSLGVGSMSAFFAINHYPRKSLMRLLYLILLIASGVYHIYRIIAGDQPRRENQLSEAATGFFLSGILVICGTNIFFSPKSSLPKE
jgi:uncharacterized membrane protein YfcA